MTIGGCASSPCKPIPFPEPPEALIQPPRQIRLIPPELRLHPFAAPPMVPQTR
jgi:hypothetical protein